MKVMVIYAHPYDKSYNHAILESTLDGLKEANHEVDLLDLNKDGFNPVMTSEDLYSLSLSKPVDPKVLEYQSRIENAQHLVFIFPVWYESVPAILKGFLDKVFSNGWAYKSVPGKNTPIGQLTHLNATVISTMGMPKMIYRLLYNNALKGVLIKGTLKFSGIKNIKWINMDNIQTVSNEKRSKWLVDVKEYMKKL